jgi:hypothetical protein
MPGTVDAYVAKLSGWQRDTVERLRAIARAASPDLVEAFKWAQPVYESGGPVCYIKAHKNHVTFGFWRGAELMARHPGLETSGIKMAHFKIRRDESIDAAALTPLIREAVKLNREKGDPNRKR